MIRKFLTGLLSLVFILSVFPGYALGYQADEQPNKLTIEETVAVLEAELNEMGTSVPKELKELRTSYQAQLLEETDPECIQNLKLLINTCSKLEAAYNEYASAKNGEISMQANKPFHPAHTVAVGAVVSWFNSQGYILSSELLMFAEENDSTNTVYHPVNKQVFRRSSTTNSILSSSKTKGSGEYNKSDNPDLYYAVHGFSWEKKTSPDRLIITDVYDYELGDTSYGNIQQVAVNAMALAQRDGYIVPYNLEVIL